MRLAGSAWGGETTAGGLREQTEGLNWCDN